MLGRLRTHIVPIAIGVVLPVAVPAAPALATRALATPALAASAERVDRDEIALTVRPDGIVHAKERIVYEFAGHGFDRSFVTRTRDNDTRDRVFKIENVRASSPDGGPTAVSVSTADGRTVVKVGAGQRVSGRHTVHLEYDIAGVIASVGSTQELRWTATGGWRVEVAAARVTVAGGAAIRNLNCFAGALATSVGCTQFFTNHTHTVGEFRQENMLPDEYLTVVVGYPAGTAKAQPLYDQRRTLATAFTVNRVTGGALLGLLLLLLGGFALLYQLRGRDARTVSRRAAEGDHAPVMEGAHFEPPDGVRPGQVGTLIDEQADVIDVTATIVDLAVRGFLLIEELPRETYGRLDWQLRRLDRPAGSPGADPADELLPYERMLYDALFNGRDSVKLGDLGGTFAGDLAKVRNALYDDVVHQGWFARRPDSVRTRWTTAGSAITLFGVVGTVVLALYTNLALIGLAVIIAGASLAIGGQYMPAKTANGATVLAHTIGFRAYLYRGQPPEEARDGQRIAVFSRYLPYAVVFDAVERWARTVADAGVREEGADNLYWYEGPAEWDLSKFAESMRTFTLATSGAISASRQFRTLS